MFNDQTFLTNLRNNTAKVSARSGGSVRFEEDTAKSYGPGNARGLEDAVKFFQDTFKVTPRVTIDNKNVQVPVGANAVTIPGVAGESRAAFKNATASEEDTQKATVKASEFLGWSAKNARQNPLAYVPIHELAHAVAFQLLENDEENRDKNDQWRLFKDALKDIGAYPSYDNMKNALKNVSGYAASSDDDSRLNQYEAVAEAITDYYYNREKAAPFSRAIVNRLRNNSATYALRQAGGVAKNSKRWTRHETPAETFRRNFRRYNVIQ